MTLTPATDIAPATVTVVGPLAVTGPLTDAQLRASAVPISAAALPLPAGAARDSTLTDGTQRVGGTVSVNVGNFPADQLVHFTTPIAVDASGFTVPVSGPLTAAQLLAAEPLAVTGPLTDAQLRASVVPVGDGGGSLTVDGTVAATQGTSPWVVGDGGGSLSVDDNGGSLTVDGPLTNAQLLAAGLATEATLAAVEAALADLASDATLADVREAVNDIALTAILQREKVSE